MIHNILQEINLENGSNHKKKVIEQNKDNKLLKRVLSMTMDKTTYTYGITMKNIVYTPSDTAAITLEEALDILEQKFCSGEYTGNNAIQKLQELLESLKSEDALLVEKIIGRDLKSRIQTSVVNKVIPGLIDNPTYNRCGIYGPKTAKDITFPALLQLKIDGTYREFFVKNGVVVCRSRSGEYYEYPELFCEFLGFKDGYYIGELTVNGMTDRATANGLINSDNPPYNDLIVNLWDYITESEYQKAKFKNKKDPCTIFYRDRWNELYSELKKYTGKMLKPVTSVEVNSIQEALKQTSGWMTSGEEGAILKDYEKLVVKDGTSKYQLKLKLEIELEVRCTGFTAGTKGTKREQYFGAMTFETDDDTIRGQCSGFSDTQLEEITPKQDFYIGKIFTVKCTDITKGKNNDYHALLHPRFVNWRNDRTTTDDFERAMAQRDSSMMIS